MKLLYLIGGLFLPFIVLSQQYNFTNYSAEYGVESQILSLYQDSRGYIWIGTQGGGVNKYNGSEFVNYSKTNGLSNNTVNSIIEDNDGNIWLGTDNGLDKFDGKTFSYYNEKDGLSNPSIKELQKDKAGNLWICTYGGVEVFDGHKFIQHYNQKSGLKSKRLSNIFKDSKDNFWLTFDDTAGVQELSDHKITFFKPTGNKTFGDGAEDEKGTIWFNCFEEGIYAYNGKQFHHYSLSYLGFPPNAEANVVFVDSRHTLWVGTKGDGVTRYAIARANDGPDSLIALKHFSKEDGLADAVLYCMLEDKDHNIWFGTNGGGVSKYSGDKFVHFTEKEGVGSSVFQIVEDRKGEIWVTGEGETYKFVDKKQFVKQEPKDFSCDVGPFPKVSPIFQDSRKNLWFYASSKLVHSLARYDGVKFYKYTIKDGMLSELIYAFCEDKNGEMYFATDRGIMRYSTDAAKGQKPFTTYLDYKVSNMAEPNTVHTAYGDVQENFIMNIEKPMAVETIFMDGKNNLWFSVERKGVFKYDGKKVIHYPGNGLSDNTINHFVEDRKGNLWLAGDHGINKYEGDHFVAYLKKDGFSDETANSLLADSRGNMWFGTDGDGIIKYDGKNFIHLRDSIRMNNAIMGLIFDNDSNLWAATNSGIVKIKWKQGKLSYKVYAKSEGFAGIECNQDAIFKDREGNLWFGTAPMLTEYNPNEETPDNIPPQTHITAVNLFYEKTDWSNYSNALTAWYKLPLDLTLPFNKNQLTFHYVGVSHRSQNIGYRIMLEGLDKDWSPETDKREITYSNIPPGNYVFKVLSRNADGVWNKEPATFRFVIAPPWWQTWWFYTLSLVFILLAIYGFIAWRMRKLKLEKLHLESVISERTAELVKQKALVEEKNKNVVDSITYAKRLQNAILPSLSSIKANLPDSFVLYKPKDIVAGDFYWMDRIGDNILIAACDCTGHGVPGAMISVVCSNALNRAVKEFNIRDTGKLLDQTRDIVLETFKKSGSNVHDGMDISFCAINLEENRLEWSGANNPLWYFRNNEIKELEPDKQPIGKQDNAKPFTTHVINIHKGDILYLFTDGYADQFGGPKGKKFKYKQLKEKLLSMASVSMEKQKQILDETLETWKGNLEQVDDILIVGIRI